jgi:hypothetical protein
MAKTIRVDLSDIEEADNRSTNYYGGEYKVGGVTLQAHGNDRNSAYYPDLYAEICNQFGLDLVDFHDAADHLEDEDIHFWPGQVFDLTLNDDGSISGKEIKDSEPKAPSKDDAEKWLKAMGIEVKMIDGEPKVRAADVERIKKIFK